LSNAADLIRAIAGILWVGSALAAILILRNIMLIAAVRTASPDRLGWHPHGFFTPAGFAAIGAAEGIVHGHDIAAGLSMAWSPNSQLCEQVLSTVFPDVERRAAATALTTLLIQSGRHERPQGKPARTWNYSAAAARPLSVNR